MLATTNPLLTLSYEPEFQSLGEEYADVVQAATFPQQQLRFRNNELLPLLGLTPEQVSDPEWLEAFGAFWGRSPLLAMRYHGYQFGQYNPGLGDGRGFLYGQVRGVDGQLYDLGTKGSGTTPYSRSGDGRLTLKGGVREVLAAEALQALGVRTSRCLSLIETGEQLWRGDEPSPTRSSVMVRFQRSHIRFGTFERLHYYGRKDLVQTLLDHVIAVYYPHYQGDPDAYTKFYAELVQRVAELAAQWTAVGFCHAVLNTDNMAITAESFDYGPYAFINTYDPQFTAAYFDYAGRYSYGNQPGICRLNLAMLQTPLAMVMSLADMEEALKPYDEAFRSTYRQIMLNRLGFDPKTMTLAEDLKIELIRQTLVLLQTTQVGYHDFFARLRLWFVPQWRDDPSRIPATLFLPVEPLNLGPHSLEPLNQADFHPEGWDQWRDLYHLALNQISPEALAAIPSHLARQNPLTPLVRPNIEAIWEAIAERDDWQPFATLLDQLKTLG